MNVSSLFGLGYLLEGWEEKNTIKVWKS